MKKENIYRQYQEQTIKGDKKNTLIIACKNNFEISKIENLIKKSKKINQKNENGNNALLIATKNNNINIITLLIKSNCNLNLKDNNDNSALLIAINNNNEQIVNLLIKNNCDINVKDKNNDSALVLSTFDNKNINIFELLILNGSEIDLKNKKLFLFFINYLKLDFFNNDKLFNLDNEKIIELFLIYGNYENKKHIKLAIFKTYYKNYKNIYKETILMKSVEFFTSEEILNQFILKEENLEKIDKLGNTVLLIAIKISNIWAVKLLIKSNCDINKSNFNKHTPLIISLAAINMREISNFKHKNLEIEDLNRSKAIFKILSKNKKLKINK